MDKVATIKREEYDPEYKLRNIKGLKHTAIGAGIGAIPGALMAKDIYEKTKPSSTIKTFEPELAKKYERLARMLARRQFLGGVGAGAGIGALTVGVPSLVKGIKNYNELRGKGKKMKKVAKFNIMKRLKKPFKAYADILTGRRIDKYHNLSMKLVRDAEKPALEANALIGEAKKIKPNFLDNHAWGEALNPVRRSYHAVAESRLKRADELLGRATKIREKYDKELKKQTVATYGTILGAASIPSVALGVATQTPWFKRYEKKGIEDIIKNYPNEYSKNKDYYDKRLAKLNSQLNKKASYKDAIYKLAEELTKEKTTIKADLIKPSVSKMEKPETMLRKAETNLKKKPIRNFNTMGYRG